MEHPDIDMTKAAFTSLKRGLQQAIDHRKTGRALEKLKGVRGSENVFLDLGFNKPEALNLKMRSDLMIAIEKFYRRNGFAPAQARKRLGITQVQVDALLKGKIEQLSLDALVKIATRADLEVRLVIGEGSGGVTTSARARRTRSSARR